MGRDHLYSILRSLAVVQCEPDPPGISTDLYTEFSDLMDDSQLQQIFSDKVFKIIITSKPAGSFSSTVWRSSHVVYFSEI
jgi:hypothetical protein